MGLLWVSAPSGPAAPRVQPLVEGVAVAARLAGGEALLYALEPERAGAAGRRLVVVEQRGIDVEVEALSPDGRSLAVVDAPTDSQGPDSLLLPRDATGALQIAVRSPNRGAAPGELSIRVERLPEATAADRERLEAERLGSEAGARNREPTAASRRLAADLYGQAAERWRALGSRAGELWSTLAAGGVEVSLGEPRRALARYRQALTLAGEARDEPGLAVAWSGLGLAQQAVGDFGEAAAAQRRALALERRLGRPYEEAKALNNLGLALHSQGDLAGARDLYQQALALFRGVGEAGWWEANVLHNLAEIQWSLGEPGEALARDREILDRMRQLGDRRGEAQTLNSLGVLHNDLGEMDAALDAYAAALAIFEETGDRRWQGLELHNLGVCYLTLGDYPRARAELGPALAVWREIGDRAGEGATEADLGQLHLRLGEIEPARAAGRRALALATAVSDRSGDLRARQLLGQVGLAAGDPAGALVELSTAFELARGLGDRPAQARLLQLTGGARLALGEAGEAARDLERAVELGRAVESPGLVIGALTRLARAERQLQRREAARAHLEQALGLIETSRTLTASPDLRASFLADRHAAFELAIDLAMELDRDSPGAGYLEAALETSERAHARALLDLLQESGADVRQGVDPGLHQRQRALLARLLALSNRRAEGFRQPPGGTAAPAAPDIAPLAAELERVEAEIRRASPRYAALTRPLPARADEIRRLLDGDTLLLEYALGDERSFLWAVDRESVAGFVLPPRVRIEAAARELYERLRVLSPGDRRLETAAAELSGLVLGPVAARLGGRPRPAKPRLVVVADGGLQYIPFAMLPVPGAAGVSPPTIPASTASAPEPLLVRHEVVHAASASAAALERRFDRRPAAPGAVAVLADPVFDLEDPRTAQRLPAPRPADLLAAARGRRRSGEEAGYLRLPWTRREAEAIAATLPAGQALVALDFRASRATALSAELGRYRVVHFATHGLIDSRSPALSGLMLSRVGEDGTPVEGLLWLGDVYNLKLGADLVVLSGCETALGREVRGEGLMGLTQGFLYAGARQVLASLWRVEDQATAELMAHFYHGLFLEHRRPAAALREAQLAVRADRRWRSPFYWSSFVLQGGWR